MEFIKGKIFSDRYEPRDVKEAEAIQKADVDGFIRGYHVGLEEGYIKASYPEQCHCRCCRSHGDWCK